MGRDRSRPWVDAAIWIGEGGGVVAMGGTLDIFGSGHVDSAFLTTAYSRNGDRLRTDER